MTWARPGRKVKFTESELEFQQESTGQHVVGAQFEYEEVRGWALPGWGHHYFWDLWWL